METARGLAAVDRADEGVMPRSACALSLMRWVSAMCESIQCSLPASMTSVCEITHLAGAGSERAEQSQRRCLMRLSGTPQIGGLRDMPASSSAASDRAAATL